MKRLVIQGIAIVSLILLFTGCGEEKMKTREYYKENLTEAKARVAECKKLKEVSMQDMQDCANADWAVFNAPDPNNPYKKQTNKPQDFILETK